jgi:hypothetical protein
MKSQITPDGDEQTLYLFIICGIIDWEVRIMKKNWDVY